MAESDPVEDSSLWTVTLEKVERITPMDPNDDVGVLFSVNLEAEGPNLSAQIEVMVVDLADEAQVVAEAIDTAQDGLEQWAAVLASRPGAEAIEPKSE